MIFLMMTLTSSYHPSNRTMKMYSIHHMPPNSKTHFQTNCPISGTPWINVKKREFQPSKVEIERSFIFNWWNKNKKNYKQKLKESMKNYHQLKVKSVMFSATTKVQEDSPLLLNYSQSYSNYLRNRHQWLQMNR